MESVYWYWWVAAAALIAMEVFAPGTLLLWLGIAAAVTGLIAMLLPDLALEFQVLVFAVLSVLAAIAGRQVVRNRQRTASEDPALNRRSDRLAGQVVTLDEPIVNGTGGRARIGDSQWSVRGPDLGVGARVKVVGIEGNHLVVERAEP